MTDDLPLHYPDESAPTRNGASGGKPCRRHDWREGETLDPWENRVVVIAMCFQCGKYRDPAASRRGRTNRSRGNRAELDIARSIPGGRKMGPLGLPWDVEVGTYARLQVKKLARCPGPAEVARLIAAIPATGDRLRGFVWVEAAGRGKRGQRLVWFLAGEFEQWHGADFGDGHPALVSMTLADWVESFVWESEDRAAARLP